MHVLLILAIVLIFGGSKGDANLGIGAPPRENPGSATVLTRHDQMRTIQLSWNLIETGYANV